MCRSKLRLRPRAANGTAHHLNTVAKLAAMAGALGAGHSTLGGPLPRKQSVGALGSGPSTGFGWHSWLRWIDTAGLSMPEQAWP